MRFRLIALVLCVGFAVPAAAVDREFSLLPRETPDPPPLRFDFRLVQDPEVPDGIPRKPVRHSGMIASTEVAPNATLGFGMLRAGSRRSTEPFRTQTRESGSRKAAVSFQLKF